MTSCPAWWRTIWPQISRLTGREYHLFNYYGAPDAERVIVAMGSCLRLPRRKSVDYLTAKGEKVGFLQVHLFRPFSSQAPAGGASQDSAGRSPCSTACKEMGSIRRAAV